MEKRILGKTGEEVSLLGFGCMRLPVLDPKDQTTIDMDLATAMVRKAIDGGVNYVDTAFPYHRNGDLTTPGESETFLAHALKNGYREKVHLATKLPTWFMESIPQMNQILDMQLKRLDVSCIDMYLAHNLNNASWPRMKALGMFDFLKDAQKDGRINHVGFSFHDSYELFEEILTAHDWEFCQIQYNFLDVNHQAGRRGLNLAAGRNVGVVVMEPLRGGFIINNMPADLRAVLTKVRPEWSMADWALRWLWSQPGVSTVLSGMSAMDQTEENVAIASRFVPFSSAEEEAIEQVREDFLRTAKVNCTACGYCLPCPQGVNIPKVFGFYNEFSRYPDPNGQFQARNGYRSQIPDDEKADHCVSCGICEEKCPQSIHISQEIPQAAAVLQS